MQERHRRIVRKLRRLFRRAGTVDVAVFGGRDHGWRHGLDAGAPVWDRLPQVRCVIAVRTPHEAARLAARTDSPVLLPVMERQIKALAYPRRALAPGPRAVETLGDKAALARYALAQGLADYIPESYPDPDAARFPLMLKRTDLNAGGGIVVVDSRAELDARLNQDPWRGQSWVLQELIEGEVEYATHCVSRNGRMIWHLTYAFKFPGDGRHVKSPAIPWDISHHEASPQTLAALGRFLAPLRYNGPANIAFKYRPDGRPAVLEINPRLGIAMLRPEYIDDLAACLGMILDHAEWQVAEPQ